MRRTRAALAFFVFFLTAAPSIQPVPGKDSGYRVRYHTYEVIAIEGNDITLRSRSGKTTLVVNKDPEKLDLHVGDYVRYNSRYNRIRKRSAEKERAYQERKARSQKGRKR